MIQRRMACNSAIAAGLLAGSHSVPCKRAKETIRQLNFLPYHELKPGKPIHKKENNEIRVALIRPLGTLIGGEEKEAVKEMGEPYQLEILAAALLSEGYQIRIFDQLAGCFDHNSPQNYPAIKSNGQFVAEIGSWQPDVACFSTFTYNFRKGLSVAAKLKEKLGLPVILGGYHTTSVGNQYLLFDSLSHINPKGADIFKDDLRFVFQHGIVDYACIGEGVLTILDIIDVLKLKKTPEEVSGIAFLKNGALMANPGSRLGLDFYPAPFRSPDFDPMKHYATGRNYPFLLLMTSSGCRYNCTYCSTGINYPGLKFRATTSVLSELQEIWKRFSSVWPVSKIMINIIDEDFGASPSRISKLCSAIHAAGLKFHFNSFLDNKTILGSKGDVLLESMYTAGFVFCFVGIESMLDSAVVGYGRPDYLENRSAQIQSAINRMNGHNLLYFGDHMAGYPGHTIADIELDYEKIFELRNMPYAYFPIVAPMPGTALYWQVLFGNLGNGFLRGVTFDQFDANHQVVQIKDGGDVKSVRDAAVQEFFIRPRYEFDMVNIIGRNPIGGQEIIHLVHKMSMDFPDNSKLAALAERLRR